MTAAVFGLVGALAAAPRRIAARDAARQGMVLRRGTTRQTTHAVFGRRLLLRLDDAAIAERLAGERQAGRQVLSENGFLRRIGALDTAEPGELGREALASRAGLPLQDLDLLALFDAFEHDAAPFSLRDLILARKYAGLIAAGATWGGIARAVHRSGETASITARTLKLGDGRAIYADAGGRLAELDGQLLLGLAAPPLDADDLFDAAEDAEARGAWDEAAGLYARCLWLDPTDAVAAYNRGNCLAAAGRPLEAEGAFLGAVRQDPSLVEAWFNLAGLLGERGEAASARRSLERAIAEDPDYADAVFNLGALAFEAGDHGTAERCWRRYLELDPGSDWARRAERGLRYIASAPVAAG